MRQKTGKVGVVLTHRATAKEWEAEVRRVVREEQARTGAEAIVGPVSLHLLFYLPRPKTVTRRWPEVRPDGDKLERAVWDALKGLLIGDDAQVVEWSGRKLYADGRPPGVEIRVTEVGG